MSNPSDQNPPGEPSVEPYEPPAVISDEVFETLSMLCGKTNTATPACKAPVGSLNVS